MIPPLYTSITKRQLGVITWTDELIRIRRNRIPLVHLIGPFYVSKLGYWSLLRLGYMIFFERHGGHPKGGSGMVYTLMKQANAISAIRTKNVTMKHGMLRAMTRNMTLRILLKQIPREGAINVPLHRYNYRLIGVSLVDATGMIIAVDSAYSE